MGTACFLLLTLAKRAVILRFVAVIPRVLAAEIGAGRAEQLYLRLRKTTSPEPAMLRRLTRRFDLDTNLGKLGWGPTARRIMKSSATHPVSLPAVTAPLRLGHPIIFSKINARRKSGNFNVRNSSRVK